PLEHGFLLVPLATVRGDEEIELTTGGEIMERLTRTTADLIEELEAEAENARQYASDLETDTSGVMASATVALIIGFNKCSRFIWGQGNKKGELSQLNDAIVGQGHPVGL